MEKETGDYLRRWRKHMKKSVHDFKLRRFTGIAWVRARSWALDG